MERKEKSQSKKKPNSTSSSIIIEEKVAEPTEDIHEEKPVEENKEETKKKKEKKPIRMSSILTMAGVVTLGIVSGSAIGLWLKNNNQASSGLSVDPGALEDEKNQISTKWKNAQEKGLDYYETFTPIEMAQIAMMNLEQDEYIAESNGKTVAGSLSTQNITSIKAHFKNKAYFENISFGEAAIVGKVEVGKRYIGVGDNITWYSFDKLSLKGTEKKTEVPVYLATYKDKANEMTSEAFEEKYGNPLSGPTDYIISSETLDESEEVAVKEKEGDDQIVIRFNLLDSAAAKYKKKIKATEDKVSQVNGFNYIRITCTLSKDLKMKEFYVEEQYKMVALSIQRVTCTAFLRSTYYYDVSEDDLPTSVEEYKFRGDVQ